MKQKLIIALLLLAGFSAAAQDSLQISGTIGRLHGNEIRLLGYNGLQAAPISSSTLDDEGHFTLRYPAGYVGAALLQIKDGANLVLLLNHEKFSIRWPDAENMGNMIFDHSPENTAFSTGIDLRMQAEEKLAGLRYLLPRYAGQAKESAWLNKEIDIQASKLNRYLQQLPENSYAAYYLQLKQTVAGMPAGEQVSETELRQISKAYSAIDFADERLWYSGLLMEIISGYYGLMAKVKEQPYADTLAGEFTNAWVKKLAGQPGKQQDVAERSFKTAEQHYLSAVAEHIALSMLSQSNCTLDEKRTQLFEQYRKMSVGNKAADIDFGDGATLRAHPAAYKLVVFGASWCPNCNNDYPALVGKYKALKDPYKLEVFYVSIDTSLDFFNTYYAEAPFVKYCDGKGWKTRAALDYYVMATPTCFLLDNTLNIVAKIADPNHLEAWLTQNARVKE